MVKTVCTPQDPPLYTHCHVVSKRSSNNEHANVFEMFSFRNNRAHGLLSSTSREEPCASKADYPDGVIFRRSLTDRQPIRAVAGLHRVESDRVSGWNHAVEAGLSGLTLQGEEETFALRLITHYLAYYTATRHRHKSFHAANSFEMSLLQVTSFR